MLRDLYRAYDGPVPYWEKPGRSQIDLLNDLIKFHQNKTKEALASIIKFMLNPELFQSSDSQREAVDRLKSLVSENSESAQFYREQLAALTPQSSTPAGAK